MPEYCLEMESFEDPARSAAQIICEHENFIRGVLSSQNTSPESVDDLFQDFYLQLIAIPVPQDVRDIKSYLYRAVINHLNDSYRRIRAHKEAIKRFHNGNSFEAGKSDPARTISLKEEMNKLFEFIRETSSGQRYMAITLRYRDGYSIQEISERMGIKYSSVRKYIYFGLGKVRKCLNDT